MTIYGVARTVVFWSLAAGMVWFAVHIEWETVPRNVLAFIFFLITMALVGVDTPKAI